MTLRRSWLLSKLMTQVEIIGGTHVRYYTTASFTEVAQYVNRCLDFAERRVAGDREQCGDGQGIVGGKHLDVERFDSQPKYEIC